MLRLLYLLTRRPDVSPAEFTDHWAEHHVATHGRPVDALRRYVLYRADEPSEDGFSGAVSVWCDDEEALTGALSGAMAEAGRDEQRFIDHARSAAFVVDDEAVEEPAWDAAVVAFECLALPPDAAARVVPAARAALAVPRSETLLKGLVVSRPRPAAATGPYESIGTPVPVYDVVIGYYFDSLLAARLLVEGEHGVGAASASR